MSSYLVCVLLLLNVQQTPPRSPTYTIYTHTVGGGAADYLEFCLFIVFFIFKKNRILLFVYFTHNQMFSCVKIKST